MAVTRIKSNQITDLAVTNAKIANYAIQGGKLANSLTYGSDLTVSGNLTVSGTTTTVDSVTTTIDDPILLLASTQTGAASVDIGILGERGDDTNVFMGYDESADEFVMALTSTSDSNSAVTVTDYVTTHVGGLTVDDNATVGGTMTATGNVTGGNLLTGNVTVADADITATGTVEGGNLVSSALTAGRITYAGTDGLLVDQANLTYDGNSLRVPIIEASDSITATYTITATGNITGGNLVTAGDVTTATVTATGNVTGGNLLTGNVTIGTTQSQ